MKKEDFLFILSISMRTIHKPYLLFLFNEMIVRVLLKSLFNASKGPLKRRLRASLMPLKGLSTKSTIFSGKNIDLKQPI